jgi:septal ring factor EnvC (AmiA/AmiB activator)
LLKLFEKEDLMRKAAAIVLRCVVAAALCGAPQVVFAQNVTEQQKEKTEQKKEKKTKEQKVKKDDKAKKKSDLVAEVNRIYDSFKKSEEPVKKEAGSLRKSINDTWDKFK